MQFHPKDLSELDDLTEEHLGFSALSEGLGFSKKPEKKKPSPLDFDEEEALEKSSTGTGAVAAGFARPAPEMFKKMVAPATAPAAATARAKTNVLAEPAAPRHLRAGAFLLDTLFVLLPLSLAWWASFGSEAWDFFLADMASPLFLFSAIFVAYFLLSESFGGQSLAKMLLHLRVVEDDKYQKPIGLSHAAIRIVLLLVGTAALGLGLLASFWDSKRRPWQDRYSGSIVRRQA